MNRISFLKNIIGIAGIGALPKNWVKSYRKIYLLQFFVRGFQFADGLKILEQMEENQMLELVREPENKYDTNAIALYFNEHKIGFVPKEKNEILARLMDSETIVLMAEIVKIEPTAKAWENVFATIYILKEETEPFGANEKPLTQVKTPKYYTLKRDKDHVSRVTLDHVKEQASKTDYYQILVKQSQTDRVFDLIHDCFPHPMQLEEAMENGIFAFKKENIPAFMLEDIKAAEQMIETELQQGTYYLTQGGNILLEHINDIKSIVSIPNPTNELVKIFEIEWV
jgi:hypothetical protein